MRFGAGRSFTALAVPPATWMPSNYLVTGPPRSGKTTVVERTVALLADAGSEAGGVYCPEIRPDGERVGFEIRDAMTGASRVLAHVDRESGPSVGKYRVDVAAVDEVGAAAIERALAEAAVVVVDEIAPMEVKSDAFCRWVRRAFDWETPVVAAVHERSEAGFVGEVKARDDAELFAVTTETRDELPETLAALVDQ